jgi:hypothetical protein
MRWLLVAASVPSSPIIATLMMAVLHFSETSVLIRTAWRNITEDGILQLIYCLNVCPFFLQSLLIAKNLISS